jgi:hypothetical protein
MTTDRVNARLLSAILAVVSIAILLLVIVPRDDAGELVIRGDLEKSRVVLDVTKLTLDTYSELLQLLGASFGVVSFLVGYHRDQHLQLPARAWARLSIGVLLLATALLLTLLGREKILTMLARDAVDLGADSLLYLRWSSYTAFTLAAVLVSSFAVSAANAGAVAIAGRPAAGKEAS